MQLPQPWRSAQIETLRAQLFKIGARVRQTARCIRCTARECFRVGGRRSCYKYTGFEGR